MYVCVVSTTYVKTGGTSPPPGGHSAGKGGGEFLHGINVIGTTRALLPPPGPPGKHCQLSINGLRPALPNES